MENHEDNRWLDAIDSTYTPKMREIVSPTLRDLRRALSGDGRSRLFIAAFVVVLASFVLGVGL